MDPSTLARQPRVYSWIPTLELEPGMVIAREVFSGAGINSAIHLAAGTKITANTIDQLFNKGVECIAVIRDPLDDETYATYVRQYEARLHEIFGPTPDENCRSLLDALLSDGPN